MGVQTGDVVVTVGVMELETRLDVVSVGIGMVMAPEDSVGVAEVEGIVVGAKVEIGTKVEPGVDEELALLTLTLTPVPVPVLVLVLVRVLDGVDEVESEVEVGTV